MPTTRTVSSPSIPKVSKTLEYGTGLRSVADGVEEVPATLRERVVDDAENLRSDLGLGTAATTAATDYATAAQGTDERVPTAAGIAAKIHAASNKSTLADADEFCISDSEATYGFKNVLWSYIKGLFATLSHTHGSITNDGKVGSTANLPLHTGTAGVVEAGAFGSSAAQFCEGNDTRLALAADIKRQGFLNTTETTISFAGTTLTLADAGSGWSYYRAGIKYTITGNKTQVLSDSAAGIYYFYIDATNGTITCSAVNTPWTLTDTKVPVATVTYNSTLTPTFWLADERHTILIDQRMQYYEHSVSGAKLKVVPTIDPATYTVDSDTDAAKAYGISTATVLDQDLIVVQSELSEGNGTDANYVCFYRTAAAAWSWEKLAMPFRWTTSGYIQYDSSGTMTEGQALKYYNYYVLVTNKVGNAGAASDARFIVIPGRGEFASLAAAQAESLSTFTFGGFEAEESTIVYRTTWQTSNSFSSKGKCKLAAIPQAVQVAITGAAIASGTTHNTLSGLQGGTSSEYYHLTSAQHDAATAAQAAATASIRAIGTSATEAAAGNHTHSTASTSGAGFSPQATAPASPMMNVLAIVNGETAHSDKALFDATHPEALGTAAEGSAMTAARRDHVHAMPTSAQIGVPRPLIFDFDGDGAAISEDTVVVIPKLPYGFTPTYWHIKASANARNGVAAAASIAFGIYVDDWNLDSNPTTSVGGTLPSITTKIGATAAASFTDTTWAAGQTVLVKPTGTPTAKWATLIIDGVET